MLVPKLIPLVAPTVLPKVSEMALLAVLVSAFPTVLVIVLPTESETEVPLIMESLLFILPPTLAIGVVKPPLTAFELVCDFPLFIPLV